MSCRLLLFALPVSICLAQQPRPSNAPLSAAQPGLYIISGKVVNGVSGEALAEAQVSLASNADRGERVTAISDANGRFAFDNVPAGKYALAAKRRGFIRQALDQHDAFSTAVVVGPSLDAGHIVFRMTPAGSISGYVVDEDNEPVGGAQVWLFVRNVSMGVAGNHFITSSGTNERGHYRFPTLAPGTYFLAVTAQPWYAEGRQRPMSRFNATAQREPEPDTGHSPFDVAYPLTYYNGAAEFASATPVTLAPGNNATANINLRAVPAVHLLLQAPAEETARQQNIQLFHEGPGGTRMYVGASQYGSNNGMYVGGFAPGHYEVEVRHFDPKDGKMIDSGIQTIDATGDGTFEPHPATTGSISGKIISDRPLPDAQQFFVQLRAGPSVDLMSAQVGPDGAVSFPNLVARPGKYAVFLVGQPDLTVQSVAATGAKATGRMVELTGSGAVELTIAVASGKQSEVEGFVLQDDNPIAGAMVLLVSEDTPFVGAFAPRDQSDTDGSFTIGQVMPGRYQALAIDDGAGLEYTNPEVIRPYLTAAKSITVAPGAKVKLKLAVQTRIK